MVPPRCPAAYAHHAGDWPVLAAAAVYRGWPVPAVYVEASGAAGEPVAALGWLEAAVCRGGHDGLLVPSPGLLGDAPWLMGLLRLCTRHGVPVGVVLAGVEHAAGRPAAQVAHEVLAAIVEGRVADVLALTDPKVTCLPVTRPALSVYEGHAAMAVLVGDLRAAWGRYQVKVVDAGPVEGVPAREGGGQRVTLRLVVAGSDRGDMAVRPVLTEFTVRGGLVTRIESSYAHQD